MKPDDYGFGRSVSLFFLEATGIVPKEWFRCSTRRGFTSEEFLLLIKSSLFPLFIFLSVEITYSQSELKKIIPPSPTVAALGEYGNTQISYYTGSLGISIPFHEVRSGDISLPISLSYNTKGIKVEETASWVGLGWSLNAGGIISRTVRGRPDEYGNGYMSPTVTKVSDMFDDWPEYNWLEEFDASASWPNNFITLIQDIADGNIDTEPDMFFFNFGNHSGKFYYDQDAETFVSIPRGSIYFDKDYFYTNNKWHLITEDGVEYFFEIKEQNLNYSECNGSPSAPELITTGWFLTSIYSPSTGRQVNLYYDESSYVSKNIASVTINTPVPGSGTGTPQIPETKICNSINNYSGYRLDSIVYDGGKVVFNALTDRCDLPGDKRLDNIEIYNKISPSIQKKFEFGYTYFNNNIISNCGDEATSYNVRLKLTSITTLDRSGNALPPYSFEYNEANSLPSRMSYSQDAWGYYNHATNDNLVPPFIPALLYYKGANRVVDTTYTSTGILTKINYPTGGNTTFEFENNKVSDYIMFSKNQYLVNRMEILDTSDDCNGSDPSPVFCKSVVINDQRGTGAYVNIKIMNMNCWDCNSVPPPAPTTCAILSLGGMQLVCSQDYVYVPNGTYNLMADFSGSTNPAEYSDFSIQLLWEEYNPPPGTHISNIGGLRVKKIIDNDGQGVVKSRRFEYAGGALSENKMFQPYQMAALVGSDEEYTYYVRPSYSNIPHGATQGSSVGYPVVTEYNSDGNNGKTVYNYSNAGQFGDYFNYAFPFGDPINLDYRRGLLIKREDYRWTGSEYAILKSVENDYKPLDTFYDWEDLNLTTQDPLFNQTVGIRAAYIDSWFNGNKPYAYPITYKTVSEWVRLMKTTEKVYDYNGDNNETITEYEYANPAHMQPTQTSVSRSNSGKSITYQRYPLDYTTGLSTSFGIKALQTKHIINATIEKVQSEMDALGNEVIIGGSVLSYYNNKPLLQEVYILERASSIPENNFSFSTLDGQGNFQMNSNYKSRVEFTKYDYLNGNLLEQEKNSDIRYSYLYGYNATLPIAEVVNAQYENVFHTSFEEDGVGFVGPSNENLAKTGVKVLNSGNYSIPSSFDPPIPSVLLMTYWYWSNNQWNFSGELTYSQNITAPGSKLDEVRVYPKGSRITTYTHDPGIGVTTVTDHNNLISHYTYDSFGRLQLIKDDKGNILKSYQYDYKNSNGQ